MPKTIYKLSRSLALSHASTNPGSTRSPVHRACSASDPQWDHGMLQTSQFPSSTHGFCGHFIFVSIPHPPHSPRPQAFLFPALFKTLVQCNLFKSLGFQLFKINSTIAGTNVLLWPVPLLSLKQFHSIAQSCPTLFDPMDYSTPGLPVHYQLPEFIQTPVHWVSDAIQPSHLLSSPSPPTFNLSPHQGLFQWVKSLHQVAKVLFVHHKN